jgi:hypothetical protein
MLISRFYCTSNGKSALGAERNNEVVLIYENPGKYLGVFSLASENSQNNRPPTPFPVGIVHLPLEASAQQPTQTF